MASSNKRFLFATDFSNFSDHALEHALLWAKACKATLDCVYVIAVDRHLDVDGAVIETFLDEERKATQPKFDALVATIQAEAGPCDDYFLTGVPDEVISKLAQEIGADCLFMGTRGWRGMNRILLCSTAERVVMTASCPVLTARLQIDPAPSKASPSKGLSQNTSRSVSSPSRLLVPIDFSDCSQDCMECAFDVAKDFDAAVTLLHVRELLPYSLDFTLAHLAMEKDQNREIEKRLKELSRDFREKGVSASYLMKPPPPADTILHTLEETGADMIVMGTHGRRGFSRLMMGSVASSVLRRSPVPVLTVKAGQRSPEHPLREKTSVQAAPSPETS